SDRARGAAVLVTIRADRNDVFQVVEREKEALRLSQGSVPLWRVRLMTSQSPQPRNRRRIKWAIVVLFVTIVPWISVILIAHEYLPGSIVLTNGLFAVALGVTYFGCWSLAVVLGSSPRLMFMRLLAATLVAVTSLLVLEVPAMLNLVDWTVVDRRL